MQHLVLLLLVVLACTPSGLPRSDASATGSYTSLDYTTETQWSLSLIFDRDGKSRPLRTVLPHLAMHYVSGEYDEPLAFTGGYRLHLFPNLEYAITYWCDLCVEEALELGTWTLTDGLVGLTPTSAGGSAPQRLKFLRESIGDYRSLRLFVTIDAGGIDQSILVTQERLASSQPEVVDGLIRRSEYLDWPKSLIRLKGTLSTSPSD